MKTGEQAGAIVMGAVLVGIWLAWSLLEDPAWFPWGGFGLAIAGGLYAAKLGSDAVRLVLWICAGLALGFLAVFAVLQASPAFLGTVFAFAGASLIAAAIPAPHGDESLA